MVMLVQLPVPDSTGNKSSGNPVPDPPGGSGTGQRMALIRNTNFSAAPNGPAIPFSGWQIVNDNIPTGPRRLWLSGGHNAAPLFFCAGSTTSTSFSRLPPRPSHLGPDRRAPAQGTV